MTVHEDLQRLEDARRHQERVERARAVYGEGAQKALADRRAS
jgi:hypothetical protein